MKIQFASIAKGLRRRALVFAIVLVAVPAVWLTISFSQDSGTVSAPTNAPYDATIGAQQMTTERTFGGVPIPPDAYQNGMKQWSAIAPAVILPKIIASKNKKGGPPIAKPAVSSINGVVWKPLGPSGITAGSSIWNGRVDAIAISPTNPSVIYLGATDGGIWKTIDAGADWTPLLDHQAMLAIGEPSAIAIDPNNTDTIYAGSSSYLKDTGAQGTQINTTIGILKSTDGGGSWITLGSGFPASNVGNASQFVNQSIFGIAVDPANSNNLYLAASSGLYFSIDAGQNWTVGSGASGVQADYLAFDPSSPVGSRVLFGGLNGVGVVESTDGGMTWTQSLNSTTPAVAARLTAHSGATIGKVSIGLAPPTSTPNPAGVQVIYATIEGRGGNFAIASSPYTNTLGIFESTDQGATWTWKGNGPFNAVSGVCQCFYTMSLAVDPGSPGDGVNDFLYWGGTDTWLSTNSGTSFSDVTHGIHADSHSWAFAPGTPSIVYAGNDGGIWRSLDMGATWTGTGGPTPTINAGGLSIGLLYHMDIKQDATASVTLGAFQDNGIDQWTGTPEWTNTYGGDGCNVIFDQQDKSDAYGMGDGGPAMSSNSGGTWSDITNNIPNNAHTDGQIQTFANSITVDPSKAGYLYFGGAANSTMPPPPSTNIPGQLWQSTNFGASWTQMTNFTAFAGAGPTAVAPANSNYLAVLNGNTLYITVDALAVSPSFTMIPGTPSSQMTRLSFDPNDPTMLYFVTSGFAGSHVFYEKFTVSGGTVVPGAVTDISPPLNVPFDGLALDGGTTPTTIYAGSDLGVLRSVDGGVTWTTLDPLHFPNAVVSDLQINPTAGVLRASTFGRGVFDFGAATGPVIAVNPQNNLQFGTTCAGDTVSLNLAIFNVGTTDLIINSVQRQAGSTDFSVAPNPTTPVTISPNAEVDFTIQFTPSIVGPQTATIAISSNDPGSPTTVLTATGTEGNGTENVTGTGIFSNTVCSGGTGATQTLKINNVGNCNLDVSSATLTGCSSAFSLVNPAEFPATISADSSLGVGINFSPTMTGLQTCTLAIDSDDPVNPDIFIPLSGEEGSGTINVTGSGDFGASVCGGKAPPQTLKLNNVGPCGLIVTSAVISCADFTLVNPGEFPATISADSELDVGVNFTPTSAGPKSCTLTVTSNDPVNPVVNIPLTATTPLGSASLTLPAAGLTFPPTIIQQEAACPDPMTVPITNGGMCPVQINSVDLTQSSSPLDYTLSGLPGLPLQLGAGDELGAGDFDLVFEPFTLARESTGTVNITFVNDPITGATSTDQVPFCGEAVHRGVRVLVTLGGVPVAKVKRIEIQNAYSPAQSVGIKTIKTVKDALLQTVTGTAPCPSFQFQAEFGGISNPGALKDGTYRIRVRLKVGKKLKTRVVRVVLDRCSFTPNIIVAF
jgi:Abnormal spindle-like microcephaly-assoc'd, ASPM-SPD-2-Hydin